MSWTEAGGSELTSWGQLRQFDCDEYDEEYIAEQNQILAEQYGEFVKMTYGPQGKLGYQCELCDSHMNGEPSLESHCAGMKHLKKKNKFIEDQQTDRSMVEDFYGAPSKDNFRGGGWGSEIVPRRPSPPRPQPVEDVTKNMTTEEKLIYKLGPQCIQDNEDAVCALNGVSSLSKLLKDYFRERNQQQASESMLEVELKFSTIQALSSTRKNCPFAPKQAEYKDYHRGTEERGNRWETPSTQRQLVPTYRRDSDDHYRRGYDRDRSPDRSRDRYGSRDRDRHY